MLLDKILYKKGIYKTQNAEHNIKYDKMEIEDDDKMLGKN